jgi:outer membrane protein TolC
MKRILILPVMLSMALLSYGQAPDTVTLDFCYQMVRKNWPLSRQFDLMGKSSGLKIKNLNRNYLPQVNINGNASLQSDVTTIGLNLPSSFPSIAFPVVSKDWYKLTLDVNQPIYDGHVISYQKKLENSSLQTDEKSVEVELYKLKDRVNLAYFSILFAKETDSLLSSTRSLLEAKLKEVRSAVANGVQLATNADAIEVEIYKIDQQLSDLRNDKAAAYQVLSELTSVNIPENAKLVMPVVNLPSLAYENSRPEYQLFDLQKDHIQIMKNMVTTKWNPRLYAYGQAGYGRPGFNMLSNDFTPWWIFGAKLSWNLWNWNQNKTEKKIYDIQGDILMNQKETFDKNTRAEADKGRQEVIRLTELLQKDGDIVRMREKITRTSLSQMENGIITSSEYISRLNEEIQAKVSYDLHRVQLVKAKLSYLFILGKL